MKTLSRPRKPRPILARWTGAAQRTRILASSSALLWRRKWVILLCLTLIPLAVYVYSDRLTKTFQASTIIQVQGTATDAGLFVERRTCRRGTANTAKIAALVGTSGVADEAARLHGRAEGLAPRRDQRHGRRGHRLHHDHRHGGQRRARRGDREHGRQGAAGSRASEAGVRRVDASIANVEKELAKLPPGEELQRSQLSERLQGLRALRAAQSENTQVVRAGTRSGQPRSRRIRSATRSSPSSSRC